MPPETEAKPGDEPHDPSRELGGLGLPAGGALPTRIEGARAGLSPTLVLVGLSGSEQVDVYLHHTPPLREMQVDELLELLLGRSRRSASPALPIGRARRCLLSRRGPAHRGATRTRRSHRWGSSAGGLGWRGVGASPHPAARPGGCDVGIRASTPRGTAMAPDEWRRFGLSPLSFLRRVLAVAVDMLRHEEPAYLNWSDYAQYDNWARSARPMNLSAKRSPPDLVPDATSVSKRRLG